MKGVLKRERALAERRRSLLARSTAQRAQIAAALDSFRPGLESAERAFRLGQWVRRHAALLALGASALLAVKRPRGALQLVAKAWTTWRTLKALT